MCKRESSHMTHTHTHSTLHKPFACTHKHTHTSVLMTHTGEVWRGLRNAWWDTETGTHDIQRNTREAPQPQGAGKRVMGVKGWGRMGGCRQHAQTERRCAEHWAWAVGPSQTRWKRRRDILKGGRKVGKEVNWRCHQCGLPFLFFFFLLNIS